MAFIGNKVGLNVALPENNRWPFVPHPLKKKKPMRAVCCTSNYFSHLKLVAYIFMTLGSSVVRLEVPVVPSFNFQQSVITA